VLISNAHSLKLCQNLGFVAQGEPKSGYVNLRRAQG
jgi:hypothetical protein